MMLPTIHLNGTSADTLLEEIEGAYTALEIAERVLRAAAPNARDYYPTGGSAFVVAACEHLTRVNAIRKVREEVEEILGHLVEHKS